MKINKKQNKILIAAAIISFIAIVYFIIGANKILDTNTLESIVQQTESGYSTITFSEPAVGTRLKQDRLDGNDVVFVPIKDSAKRLGKLICSFEVAGRINRMPIDGTSTSKTGAALCDHDGCIIRCGSLDKDPNVKLIATIDYDGAEYFISKSNAAGIS